jgi:hypothetical protein
MYFTLPTREWRVHIPYSSQCKKKTIVLWLGQGSAHVGVQGEKAQEGHHHRTGCTESRIRKQRLQAMHNKVGSDNETTRARSLFVYLLYASSERWGACVRQDKMIAASPKTSPSPLAVWSSSSWIISYLRERSLCADYGARNSCVRECALSAASPWNTRGQRAIIDCCRP